MKIPKREFRLPDGPCLGITDEVILYDSQILVLLIIGLIADTHQHETVPGCLPHCVDGQLYGVHSVWDTNLLLELVNVQLSIHVVSQVISLELPLVVMSSFEPGQHGVVVSLLYDVLVGPFVVFGTVYVEWLVVLLWRVVVVT